MFKTEDLNQEAIKQNNNKAILQLLYKERQQTKQEIAKKLKISIPTVTHNVKTLMDEGLVREAGVAESTGGRKPVVVEFIPDARYAFGVELSDKGFRIILTNLDTEILEDRQVALPEHNQIEQMSAILQNVTQAMLDKRQIEKEKILGIGFAIHGTVDEERQIIELAPNVDLRDISFTPFAQQLRFPIFMENEANAAALAETILGVAKSMRNLVYVSIHRGVGTGIVIQDYVYKGKNKRAGEFGHMTISVDGKQCNCGKKGCWEMYASEKALLEMYNSTVNDPVGDIDTLFHHVEAEEEGALIILEKYLKYIAVGLQNIILTLDPHYIILGGDISKYASLFMESLKKKIFIPNSFYTEEDMRIFSSSLKGNATVLGAALLPLQQIFFTNNKII